MLKGSSPIEVTVVPGESSDPTKMDFEMEVISFDESGMEIELLFKDANYISANDPSDELSITLKKDEFWQDSRGETFADDQVLIQKLPA